MNYTYCSFIFLISRYVWKISCQHWTVMILSSGWKETLSKFNNKDSRPQQGGWNQNKVSTFKLYISLIWQILKGNNYTWVHLDKAVHALLRRCLRVNRGEKSNQHYGKKAGKTGVKNEIEQTNFGWKQRKRVCKQRAEYANYTRTLHWQDLILKDNIMISEHQVQHITDQIYAYLFKIIAWIKTEFKLHN